MVRKLTEFQRALVDATLAGFAQVPREEAVEIIPSPDFEEQAEDLIRKTRRTGWYYVNTTLKRAILIAAIIGALVTTAVAVPAIREAIIDFFIEDYGDYFEFTFNPEEAANAPKRIETVFSPEYIPEGYELVLEDISTAGASFWWTNEKNQWICFNQYKMPNDPSDGDWLGLNAEDVTTKSSLIGEYLVFVIQDETFYALIWTDNSYFYRLELDNSVSRNEMEKIFTSIQHLPQYDEFLGE